LLRRTLVLLSLIQQAKHDDNRNYYSTINNKSPKSPPKAEQKLTKAVKPGSKKNKKMLL